MASDGLPEQKRSRALLVCAGLIMLLGCSEESAVAPEATVLVGDWDYSFVATNPITCPVVPVPVGCSGGGILSFVQSDSSLQGSYTVVAGCQTCGYAADYGGSGTIEDLALSKSEVSFTILHCRFTALLSQGPEGPMVGDITCKIDSQTESRGRWCMRKKR